MLETMLIRQITARTLFTTLLTYLVQFRLRTKHTNWIRNENFDSGPEKHQSKGKKGKLTTTRSWPENTTSAKLRKKNNIFSSHNSNENLSGKVMKWKGRHSIFEWSNFKLRSCQIARVWPQSSGNTYWL